MLRKSTWIRLPRSVMVGYGVLDQTGKPVTELRLSGTPLVVTSPTPRSVAGDRVVAGLRYTTSYTRRCIHPGETVS